MARSARALPMAKSVKAEKAPRIVEADDPQRALYRKLNFFPTPLWATRAFLDLLGKLDPGPWSAWEPACGQGHMAAVLAEHFASVLATDIHPHGWAGQTGLGDFVGDDFEGVEVDWVVCNPPFELAAEFVLTGLRRARRGAAMLCRLNWIESAGRFPLFFGDQPMTVFAPFAERVGMQLGSWDPNLGSATGYAWFVWLKGDARISAQGNLTRALSPHPIIMPIPPGTKARLTRPDDARLFGARAAMPLFEGAGS